MFLEVSTTVPNMFEREGLSMLQLTPAEHEAVEKRAYRLWEERGRPVGTPEADWFRAKQELIRHWDTLSALPISSLMLEPIED